jgi:hypothetical protein
VTPPPVDVWLRQWWLFPRASDPEMTLMARMVCCILSLLLGILCLVLMGDETVSPFWTLHLPQSLGLGTVDLVWKSDGAAPGAGRGV